MDTASTVPDPTGPITRAGRVLRHRATWAVRGAEGPAVPVGLPGSDDQVSQRHARAVLDLALRVGESMLASGAPAADVTATLLRLTHAYGLRSIHVDVTFTAITISAHRGLDADPLSIMRVVKVRAADYTRLQALLRLVDDITAPGPGRDTLDVDAARQRLSRILTAPHPYRPWVTTLGSAILAAAVVSLFAAGPGMIALAGVTAAVVARAQTALFSAGVAAFFAQAVSAAIPTTVAVLLWWGRSHGIELPGVYSPSLVVISGIIVLLAGLTVMGAAQDALDGYYVTAGARGLLTAGILAGISVVLVAAQRAGVELPLSPNVELTNDPVVSVIAAFFIGIGFAMTTYTGPRVAMVAAAVSALGQLTYQYVSLLQVDPAFTVWLAATVVGAVGYVAYQRLRVPELAVTTAGIVSMLPGLAVYRALFWFVQDSAGLINTALLSLFQALSTGLGLAAGISMGAYLARRRFGLDLPRARDRDL